MKKKWWVLAACVFGFVGMYVGCAPSVFHSGHKIQARPGLENVRSFAISYKKVPLSDFSSFDLIVLDPDAYSERDIHQLEKQGKIVLAYLNVGELETFRWYKTLVPDKWILEQNPEWPDHYFLDVRKRGWRRLLLNKIVPRVFWKGAQGLFLDSVDLAAPERYPELRGAMIHLIKSLRKKFPEKFLVLNNGQFFLQQVAENVNGLAVENVLTNPQGEKSPHVRSTGDVWEILKKLQKIKKKYRIPVFVVDYFPAREEVNVSDWYRLCREYGLVLYVGDYRFQRIYFKSK